MANYITLIGNKLFQPVSTLLDELFRLSSEDEKLVNKHPDEKGYSAAICLLLAVIAESFIMRARYLNSEDKISYQRSIYNFIRAKYPGCLSIDKLVEVFILRDVIAHNHLWEIESTWEKDIWKDLLHKTLNPLTEKFTDKKYREFVNLDSGITKNLELHVIPTQIDRTDVMKVLDTVLEVLQYIDEEENHALGISTIYVMFRDDFINFLEVKRRLF